MPSASLVIAGNGVGFICRAWSALESFSDRLHSRCKLFFDLRMNPDADTQDLAGIYQLEAAVFVQNADYTFAMMSAASGCDQVALVNLDNPAIGKLERECFERRA